MAEDDSTTTNPRQRFFELASIAPAAESPKPEQLGLWPDDRRGAPNVLLRSALFSAGKPTRNRKTFRDQQLAAQLPKDSALKSVVYTGPQLYQPELDVWLEVVHRCRLRPAGVETDFHVRGFLRSLHRSTGKSDYTQLVSQFRLLKATSVDITRSRPEGKPSRMKSLLQSVEYDEELGRWHVSVDEEIAELFAPKEHTWLDFDARLELGRSYLAKWCHGYFSSHRKPFPIGVQRLLELSGSANSSLRDFRRRLREAMNEVASIEKTRRRKFEWRIDAGDLVHVVRHSGN
jgi:hypothetical protein